MTHMIKLFENFDQPQEFFQKFTRNDETVNFQLWKEPNSMRDNYGIEGTFTWQCSLKYNKWGIDIDSIVLTSLSLTVELEDEDNEDMSIDKKIELTKEDLQDASKYKIVVEGFPLTITSLEVNMRHSEDPEDWKYEITLGEKRD